jgi:hypothetical protein
LLMACMPGWSAMNRAADSKATGVHSILT